MSLDLFKNLVLIPINFWLLLGENRCLFDDEILKNRIPSFKSTFKLGATNLTGKEYVVAPGSGLIGSMYYVSWTINNL